MDRRLGEEGSITPRILLRTARRRRHRRCVAAGEGYRHFPASALHRMAAEAAPARYGIRADRDAATSLLTGTPRPHYAPARCDRNINLNDQTKDLTT